MRIAFVLVPFLLISLALAYTLPGTNFKGDNDMWGHKIINASAPANASDVALQSTVTTANSSMKSYVDANDTLLHAFTVSSNASMKDYVDSVATGGGLATTGGRMTGNISMGGKYIYWLASPFNSTSAATKGYVDANDTLLDAAIVSANNSMKSYVDANDTLLAASIISANSSMKSYVDANDTLLDAAVVAANSSMKSYVDLLGKPNQDYSIAVYHDGTHVYAECRNGTRIYDGTYNTNDAAAINYAASHLTSGRTWNEVIVLRGYFRLENVIVLSSYTTLDASQASLDLYANTKLLDTDSGATHIKVVGGIWNGRKASVTGDVGIELHACTYSSLEGVTVFNTDLQCIAINYGGDHINLIQCNVSGAGNDGIVLNSVDFANIISCTSEHNAHSGIDFYDGSSLCSVVGGSFSYNGYRGIAIESATSSTNFITVDSVQLYNNSMDGVMIATTGAGATPRHNIIRGCEIHANYGSGINDQGGWYNMFTSNQIYSNHVDGIYLSGTTLDRCSENILVLNTGYGIKEYSSASNTHAHGNTAWGNGGGYSIGGTGSHNDDSYNS